MNIIVKDEADLALLDAGARTYKHPVRRDHFRAVLRAIDGTEAPEIARQLHRSRRFVQDLDYRYRDGRVAALEDKHRPGKRCKLSEEERQHFRQRILAESIYADGVCTLRGLEAGKMLDAEFDKRYSLLADYALMHRLRLSPQRPARRHKKNDPEAMKKWLAEALPFVQRVNEAHPDRRVEVWLQDEMRLGQQGTMTTVWAETGSRPTVVRQIEYL